ncbi:hypothetical protein BJY59DRAFT_592775 [Rhodotorula toruloides]
MPSMLNTGNTEVSSTRSLVATLAHASSRRRARLRSEGRRGSERRHVGLTVVPFLRDASNGDCSSPPTFLDSVLPPSHFRFHSCCHPSTVLRALQRAGTVVAVKLRRPPFAPLQSCLAPPSLPLATLRRRQCPQLALALALRKITDESGCGTPSIPLLVNFASSHR